MYFDNSENGQYILNWWRTRCLEWCYNRYEDGKFGDQKYLDDWLTRFKGVHSLQHFGGGLAPWNVQRFDFQQVGNKILGKLIAKKSQNTEGGTFDAIFFHFHGVKLYENNKTIFAPKMYLLNAAVRALFYAPYLQKLKAAQAQLTALDTRFEKLGILSAADYGRDKWKGWFAFFKTNYMRIFS